MADPFSEEREGRTAEREPSVSMGPQAAPYPGARSPPDTIELYAPPREQPAAAAPLGDPPPVPANPVLVGFLTLLVTTTLCSAAAGGLMAVWYNLTPIGGGFLAGLGETIMAIFCWMGLSAFALLSGIAMAAGILGREGKVSGAGWVITSILGSLATLLCFVPDPESTFATRGLLGLIAIGASIGVTMAVLSFARRRWIGPPRPPLWMEG